MTKPKMTKKEMLKDLLIGQLEMLRIRMVENIASIDMYVKEIEQRFREGK